MLNVAPPVPASPIAIELETSECFEDIFFKKSRYKGLYGGRGSGKSWGFADALILRGTAGKKVLVKDPRTGQMVEGGRGLRILCGREIQNSIDESVKQVIEDRIAHHGLGWFYRVTKTAIVGLNGTRFTFSGLFRNVSKIKSKEAIDVFYCDEAQDLSQDSLDKLIPTIRQPGSELWFAWNPESENDPIDQLLRSTEAPEPDPELMQGYDEWQIVKRVNWYDNDFFPDVLRVEMENDRRRDVDKYLHVWLGQYRKVTEARVFKNVRLGTREEFAQFCEPNQFIDGKIRIERYYFGGDFGFAQDPACLIRMFIHGRTLYVDREVYKTGVDIDHLPLFFGGVHDSDLMRLNREVADKALAIGYQGVPRCREYRITLDSARPDTISYLQRHGFPKAVGAKKGAGSVEDGIEFLKSYDIVISEDCPHTFNEFVSYSYKIDKKTNEVLPVLLDEDNHAIDSARYGLEETRRAQGGWTTSKGMS
ncbi:PBSX family phage terminase large subunit [Bradyrhizobium sp. Leo121]|uniref:PBSX family phage terminase large subunit n=1 Tax=Bradyrhizobium sp. Leo121 TaxID=1571195 RepID=UPI001029530F|nr:PBSX family phage terminase large subunit [Bradyrhizobium sp. Leo121]RZN30518.1 PBSX family phage terminase large subunit [Bradyrhizobium sp. Leo121]